MAKASKKSKKTQKEAVKETPKETKPQNPKVKKTKEVSEPKVKPEKVAKAVKKSEESKIVKKTSVPSKGDKSTAQKAKRYRRYEKITAEDRLNKGVVYLGHIPYGFREQEIKEFFEQFGTVSRVKLARSKKTARPKGYGFIEFESLEIAAIAAETIDGRFMFDRRLVCHVVEDNKLHKDLFKNSGRKWKYVPYQIVNSNKVNSEKSELKQCKKVTRLLQQEEEKREKIQDFFNTIGKENTYEFPGYKALVEKALNEVESK